MIILAIIASFAAIGVMCWLLFNLAVFALPLFAGITAGTWAYQSGAGWPGGIIVGIVAAGLTLVVGQLPLAFVHALWLRLLVAAAFVAPAVLAGYHATLGIVKLTMPSEGWQIAFSIVGAIAVGVCAFARLVAMPLSGDTAQSARLS
ncbi:hypothetical protein PZN02_002017 [Sinorhizobium garamanticum]|uniref:DUF4175 domain-containing protein n=1 Tax=Sinorhizobium garamanticum TaxID=680247 RepID=A0ABY8D4L5_9HYPH|nr:hypothetical protein [Sinorhizobium garamanticum]WEX85784.1 hypothetical protein PZN02_002017 [Sinorhizobium garamanticum]